MNDFWEEYGESYLVFSQFCSYKDWQGILSTIATEIIQTVSVKNIDSLYILDVGPGYGKNSLDLSNIIFETIHRRAVFDFIEPSDKAACILKHLMCEISHGGNTRNIFKSIDGIPGAHYNTILFIHSTYYISNFTKKLAYLYHNNLAKGGKIIILALPDNSPFFLSCDKLMLPFTATQITSELDNMNLKYESYSMISRLYLNHEFRLSKNEFKQLYRFITRCIIDERKFSDEIKKIINKPNIDLSDELIVLEK